MPASVAAAPKLVKTSGSDTQERYSIPTVVRLLQTRSLLSAAS